MNKTIKIYIVFLVVLIAGVVYIDSTRPKPIDWSPSYLLSDKIPYGLYVFDKESNVLAQQKPLVKSNETFYELTKSEFFNKEKDSAKTKTTLSICDDYIIDDESTKALFTFVENGNNCFISTLELPKIFTDSLNLEIKTDVDNQIDPTSKTYCWLTNKNLGTNKYDLSKGSKDSYFSKIDTTKSTILGYKSSKDKKLANFIKVPYKKGNFFIHLQPNAFTNYHLLKDNHAEYVSKVLTYLPKGEVIWLVKDQIGLLQSGSPMRYILSQPALKWAWFFFLGGMLLFMIFNAKRRQRIIPILKPLENTSVDFAKTIGNLYFQEGNHTNLIEKKIVYLLEKIRTEFLIDTSVLDENFVKKMEAKTQKDRKDIERVVYLINQHRKNRFPSTESDFIEINSAIEKITT